MLVVEAVHFAMPIANSLLQFETPRIHHSQTSDVGTGEFQFVKVQGVRIQSGDKETLFKDGAL